MMHFLYLFAGVSLIWIAADARAVASPGSTEVATPSPSFLTLEIQNAAGTSLASQSDPQKVAVSYRAVYQPGDAIVVNAPPQDKYLSVQLDDKVPESMVYCPTAHLIFPIPFGTLTNAYDPAAFQGASHSIKAHVATAKEITAYRNVALNSLDQRNVAQYFPHATASSATRNDPIFFERNAIDGNTQNQHHGKWPYESWGNDRSIKPWIKIDFGREVAIDKVRLYLRSDFPHDTCWTSATIEFSNGSLQDVTLQKIRDPQEFTFSVRKVSWIRLTNLKHPANQPLAFEALTEMEVFGKDEVLPRP